jgi:thioredoxin 1
VARPFAVTDSDFSEKVLESDIPVLVDFWAGWCMPCRLVEPIIEELAEEYDGVVKFARLDVDSNPQTSVRYGIRSIPSLILFRDGKPVSQIIGAMPKLVLKSRIDSSL